MTPEEKYKKHMAYVLRNIKERSLFASPGQKTLYNLAPNVIVAGEEVPSYEDEVALLQQLHAKQVVRIGKPHYDQDSYVVGEEPINGYFLELIEPTFSEWYEKHQEKKPIPPPVLDENGLPNTEDYDIKVGGSLDEKKGWLKAKPKNASKSDDARKSIHEELYKDGKSVDEIIAKYPQLKETLELARSGIEAQRKTMQRLYNSGVLQEVERYREKMDEIADQMQPTLKLMREIGQSPVFKLAQEVAPLKLFAEITPTAKNVSVSLMGLESDLKNLKSLQETEPLEVLYAPSHDPTTQMAGDIAEMKELTKRLFLKIGESSEQEAPAEEEKARLDFDDRTSTLYFAGEAITISTRAESDPHELLRTLFKERTKVWNLDEVLDDWKFDVAKKTPKKKVYHAGKAVNRIVAQDTKVKDFLVITTKTVVINPKYLAD